MRDTIIVVNSFIHDMATGIWVALLITMHVIYSQAGPLIGLDEGFRFLANIMQKLWMFSLISVAVVTVTGIFRALTFKYYGWTGDIARGRKKLLFVKHILLGLVFAIGLYLQFSMMSRTINPGG